MPWYKTLFRLGPLTIMKSISLRGIYIKIGKNSPFRLFVTLYALLFLAHY